MNDTNRSCFVIMPFLPELHYFFLYIQRHIEENHRVICKRGDAEILTVPVLDKIKNYMGAFLLEPHLKLKVPSPI
ncbi:hypothetical protein, partial [Candidatus Entotheonella palauensis]|uniref:hypothetical protein n=1 Tax=Candidatus Entotheonella palauensis TaxID=93172 RepID=UPI001C4E2668